MSARRGRRPSRYLAVGDGLTEREEAIVRGLTRGLTLREIADEIGVSRTVVEHGAMWLRRRLGLRNVQHLAAWGAARGYGPAGVTPAPLGTSNTV